MSLDRTAATDVFTESATGRLDSAGAMHLVFHDSQPTTYDSLVRYLVIGG